jgi:hypothetical protein
MPAEAAPKRMKDRPMWWGKSVGLSDDELRQWWSSCNALRGSVPVSTFMERLATLVRPASRQPATFCPRTDLTARQQAAQRVAWDRLMALLHAP